MLLILKLQILSVERKHHRHVILIDVWLFWHRIHLQEHLVGDLLRLSLRIYLT